MLNFNEFQATVRTGEIAQKNNLSSEAPKQQENKNLDDKKLLVANPSAMVVNKGKYALTLAVTATLACALTVVLTGRNQDKLSAKFKNLQELYDAMAKKLNSANDEIAKLNIQKADSEKAAEALRDTIADLQKRYATVTAIPKEASEVIEYKVNKYREIIKNVTSIYDGATPPKAEGIHRFKFDKLYTFEQKGVQDVKEQGTNFASALIQKLNQEGSIVVQRQNEYVAPAAEALQKAMLKGDPAENLGVRIQSDFTTAYGNRIDWSDEKIARDILQNFYDGGNFTLDGTTVRIDKLSNGKFRIKIEGDGVFEFGNLKFIGSGNKLENPRSAGGFGEGAKVVIANLLDKKHTDKIKFASADWEYVFDEQDGIIMRTLNKAPEVRQGNFIEFETENKDFAESLLKAFDYFEHKSNPDFKNLTFENDDFGFRVLDAGEKGKFYLTQRFEYGKAGKWENGVEGLNLVFKKKPDFDEFEKITGMKFDTGRDRKNMDHNDVYRLIKYFSQKMSDEEIIQSIISTQVHWQKFQMNDNSAIGSMVKALCEEARARKIGINFDDFKLCAYTGGNEAVQKSVESMGYTLIDDRSVGLNKIGMPTANELFELKSQHKALQPTQKEAKKLKVLEEATRVIQNGFESTYVAKAKELFSRIEVDDLKIPKHKSYLVNKEIWEKLQYDESTAIINSWGGYEIVDEDKFAKVLHDYVQKTVSQMDDVDSNKKLIENIATILKINNNGDSQLMQMATQLENLQIIAKSDIEAPRFIFDRNSEMAKSTLGEAILEYGVGLGKTYKGHWVDRTYLNNASFDELLATWLHEICHKSGGDGSSEFTYKLTDMLESFIAFSTSSNQYQTDLLALQKVFNEIK